MTTPTDDLWPEDLVNRQLLAPAEIMRKQATLLGQKTGHRLEAIVNSAGDSGNFRHRFVIRSPVIDYAMVLFEVNSPVSLYPLTFTVGARASRINNQEEFMVKMKDTLSSARTKSIVSGLLAQLP
jgi:hypothetical protein